MSSVTDLDPLQSSTVHTAMHCKSFRDDDILKCLEQFCGLHVQRTCIKESNVAEDSTGLAELAYTVMLTFGSLLLSECGVIAIWLHPICTTTTLLHVSHLCEYCLGASLAEINQFAGCIFPL